MAGCILAAPLLLWGNGCAQGVKGKKAAGAFLPALPDRLSDREQELCLAVHPQACAGAQARERQGDAGFGMAPCRRHCHLGTIKHQQALRGSKDPCSRRPQGRQADQNCSMGTGGRAVRGK